MSAFFKNLDLSKIYKKRKVIRKRKTVNPFPAKLYKMLQDSHEKGWEDIVSWAPDGLSFHVHNIDRFMTDVLPAYFNQTKFKSFQRQLNFYGFHRIFNSRLEEFVYTHRYLIRGNQEMCKNIIRIVGQDKSLQKETSSASSLPSKKKALIQQEDCWNMIQPLPPASSSALSSDEEASTHNDSHKSSMSSGFVNSRIHRVSSKSSDNLSFPENFDDTPISLEEDPAVFFVGTQLDLLSGLEEFMSI